MRLKPWKSHGNVKTSFKLGKNQLIDPAALAFSTNQNGFIGNCWIQTQIGLKV